MCNGEHVALKEQTNTQLRNEIQTTHGRVMQEKTVFSPQRVSRLGDVDFNTLFQYCSMDAQQYKRLGCLKIMYHMTPTRRTTPLDHHALTLTFLGLHSRNRVTACACRLPPMPSVLPLPANGQQPCHKQYFCPRSPRLLCFLHDNHRNYRCCCINFNASISSILKLFDSKFPYPD